MSLTPKQEAFAIAYMKSGGKASEAYRQAYDAQKMSDAVVAVKANELLKNGNVAVRIEFLRDSAAEMACVDESRVIAEVARLGLQDPSALFKPDGSMLAIKDMSPDIRAAIASFEVEEKRDADGEVISQLKKVKLWDKNSALEKLMKHLGSFERDNKQKAGIFDGLPKTEIDAIVERLRAIRQPSVAGRPQPASPSRFTH